MTSFAVPSIDYGPHVYVLYDRDDQPIYVGKSVSALSRIGTHRALAPWGSEIARAEVFQCASQEEANDLECVSILRIRAKHNRMVPPYGKRTGFSRCNSAKFCGSE